MCRFHRFEANYDYCLKYDMLADCGGDFDKCEQDNVEYKEDKVRQESENGR